MSSETQTEAAAAEPPDTAEGATTEATSPPGAGVLAALTANPIAVGIAVLTVAGWLIVLQVNHWHPTPGAVMLCFGWLAVLLSTWFLFAAAASATSGEADDPASFGAVATKRDELGREKKALIKAIKEVEFDRDMGKMSADDAAEIIRFYRARAIEVIKALDVEGDGTLTPAERIEREVRARLALQGIGDAASAEAASAAPTAPAVSEAPVAAPAPEPAAEPSAAPAAAPAAAAEETP